jgi:hypothetical protein
MESKEEDRSRSERTRLRIQSTCLKLVGFLTAVFLIRKSIPLPIPFLVAVAFGAGVGVFRHYKGFDYDLRPVKALTQIRKAGRLWPTIEALLIVIIQRMVELIAYVVIWRAISDENLVPALIALVLVDLGADVTQGLLSAFLSPDPSSETDE